MRKLLILLVFVFVPFARADDFDYQICSARILINMFSDRAHVDERIREINVTSSPDELLAIADEFSGNTKILPRRTGNCLEGVDTVWRLHQLLNDAYAAQSLRLAGVADADNPFARAIEAGREPLDRHFERLSAILTSGERDDLESASGSRGPDCYYEDMAEANERAMEYRMLVDGARAADDLSDLLAFSSAAVSWHERAWSVLPRCSYAYIFLIDWSRLLNAFAISRAFQLAGAPDADNRFLQEDYDQFQVGAGEATDWFSLERLDVEKRPIPGSTAFGLPNCTLSDLDAFAHLPAEFASLAEQGRTAASDEEKLQFISRQVEWRRRLWLQLPMCQQVLESAWLMQQISSDYAAMHALSFLAQTDLDTPYQEQVAADHGNALRLQELLDMFEAYRSGEQPLPPPASVTLYTCGDAVREESFWEYYEGYADVMRVAMTMESLDDALDYSRHFVEWRAGIFSRLPTCPEAIEYAWLQMLFSTDNALFRVLELAGLPSAENPYAAELKSVERRLRIVDRALLGQDPLSKESVTPGKSLLPACSQAESLTIVLPSLKFFEMLEYPRATSITEMLDYALTHLEWRDISFYDFPVCLEAHQSRLQFTQVVGDVIARRALDIDGRLYSRNPFRELPNDEERFNQLTDTLNASRRADGPPPDQRVVATCADEEIEAVADLANGIASIAGAAEALDHETGLPAFHQGLLDWRGDLMARLPQCAGAVELGWLMNDISIDLAVLHSLIYTGADASALPHSTEIPESLERMSELASELGIEIDADLTR